MAAILAQPQWASCQIPKIAGCACAGYAGNVFPDTLGQRSRHASRHVRDARAVMHAGIANWRFSLMSVAGKTFPGIPGACATRNCTYLVRGPCVEEVKNLSIILQSRLEIWIMTWKCIAFLWYCNSWCKLVWKPSFVKLILLEIVGKIYWNHCWFVCHVYNWVSWLEMYEDGRKLQFNTMATAADSLHQQGLVSI